MITLPPNSPTFGKIVRVVSPRYKDKQSFCLRTGAGSAFDFDLPGEGLLVWRVDESGDMEAPDTPGLTLIQADGRHDLENPEGWNQGDAGEPFPGSSGVVQLPDKGPISTSFPGRSLSGVTLSEIDIGDDGSVTLEVRFGARPRWLVFSVRVRGRW